MTNNPIPASERELVLTVSDADSHVHVWTARRKDITRLRKSHAAQEVKSGYHGTTEWAEFLVPEDKWNVTSGVKRRVNMTEEQREQAAERLRNARAKIT